MRYSKGKVVRPFPISGLDRVLLEGAKNSEITLHKLFTRGGEEKENCLVNIAKDTANTNIKEQFNDNIANAY